MQTKRYVSESAEEVLDCYFPVLDYGFVALKEYMGGDHSIEQAARVSYGKETRQLSSTEGLIRYLLRHDHMTPFEMPVLQFHMGMPIFVMRQLVRHRTASMNEYSGRYSVMPMLFYTPNHDQVCTQSKSNKQGRAGKISLESYGDFVTKLRESRIPVAANYQHWINESDIARETARLDLPLSTYTYCYWECDLRNLLNLMRLRSDSHAQWEIQQFSNVICGLVKRLCPIAFDAFQDYQQLSVKFSQLELSALPMVYNPATPRKDVVGYLKANGMNDRELSEFWSKLEVKEKPSYDLNLSVAKSGDYFMDMAMKSAVEIPNAA